MQENTKFCVKVMISFIKKEEEGGGGRYLNLPDPMCARNCV